MRRIVGGLIGCLIGGGAAFGIGLLVLTYGNLPQREGGTAMALFFFVMPAAAMLGAVIGAIVAGRHRP